MEIRTTPAPGADAFRWFFYASSPPWSRRATRSRTCARSRRSSRQAAKRLFVLHHLREHRRLRPARAGTSLRRGPSSIAGSGASSPDDARGHGAAWTSTTSSAPRSGSSRSSTRFPTGGCAAAARGSGGRAGTTTSAARYETLYECLSRWRSSPRRSRPTRPRRCTRTSSWARRPRRRRACTSRTGRRSTSRDRRPLSRKMRQVETSSASGCRSARSKAQASASRSARAHVVLNDAGIEGGPRPRHRTSSWRSSTP